MFLRFEKVICIDFNRRLFYRGFLVIICGLLRIHHRKFLLIILLIFIFEILHTTHKEILNIIKNIGIDRSCFNLGCYYFLLYFSLFNLFLLSSIISFLLILEFFFYNKLILLRNSKIFLRGKLILAWLLYLLSIGWRSIKI